MSNSQGHSWVSMAERLNPAEAYTQHVIDLQQEDI